MADCVGFNYRKIKISFHEQDEALEASADTINAVRFCVIETRPQIASRLTGATRPTRRLRLPSLSSRGSHPKVCHIESAQRMRCGRGGLL